MSKPEAAILRRIPAEAAAIRIHIDPAAAATVVIHDRILTPLPTRRTPTTEALLVITTPLLALIITRQHRALRSESLGIAMAESLAAPLRASDSKLRLAIPTDDRATWLIISSR